MIKTENIVGAQRVIEWFGSWPSFQDGEVVELHLSRDDDSWLRVRTVSGENSAGTARGGGQPAIVTFYLNGISDSDLRAFNDKNVIKQLEVDSTADGFKITLNEAKGLSGSITAAKLSVGLSTQF